PRGEGFARGAGCADEGVRATRAGEEHTVTTRRTFLTGAAAVAALPAVAQRARRAAPEELPPSIAALTSMRDKARPITNDERRQRLEKARQLMHAHSLDAIFVSWGTSLLYYAGIRWQGGERLFALVLPAKGEPFFVAPAFEEGRGREQIERGPFDKNTDLRL